MINTILFYYTMLYNDYQKLCCSILNFMSLKTIYKIIIKFMFCLNSGFNHNELYICDLKSSTK